MHSSSPSLRLVVHKMEVEYAIMSDVQSIDDVDDFVGESEDEVIELLCKDQRSMNIELSTEGDCYVYPYQK